jgi:hypothetical protein
MYDPTLQLYKFYTYYIARPGAELKKHVERKIPGPILRYYSSICLECLRKVRKSPQSGVHALTEPKILH